MKQIILIAAMVPLFLGAEYIGWSEPKLEFVSKTFNPPMKRKKNRKAHR